MHFHTDIVVIFILPSRPIPNKIGTKFGSRTSSYGNIENIAYEITLYLQKYIVARNTKFQKEIGGVHSKFGSRTSSYGIVENTLFEITLTYRNIKYILILL